MKVGIIFIGTSKYLNFLPSWYESVEEKFLPETEKTVFVFTDGDLEDAPDNVSVYKVPHKPWPHATLKRFEFMLMAREELAKMDWVVYLDGDMQVKETVNVSEIFSESHELFGVHHPCHFAKMPPHDKWPGAFDNNPLSSAFVEEYQYRNIYYQACFWGGRTGSFLKLCDQLSSNIQDDEDRNVLAKWHDESHLNKYFLEHWEDVNVLHPQYAFPEVFKSYLDYEPKIMHLAKNNSELQS